MFDKVNEVIHFKPPLDKDYQPLISHANGRDIFNDLREWTLEIIKGKIKLTNNVGANYEIGETTGSAVRCSLAFLNFTTPYFIIELNTGEVNLYKFDLQTKELIFLRTIQDFKYVKLAYVKGLNSTKLQICGIGLTDVYVGTVDDVNLVFDQPLNYTNIENLAINRFGLTVNNQLQLEVVTLK